MSAQPDQTLDEFITKFRQDNNVWWATTAGELLNLFEEAVDRIMAARAIHGQSIDPTECIECADGHYPCRTAIALGDRP